MLRAALFDVDGTLVDSNALHVACRADLTDLLQRHEASLLGREAPAQH